MTEPLITLLIAQLKLQGAKVDEQELDFQMLSHPSYPSVHAITGVLSHFKIPNGAFELPIEAESLTQMPAVWMAQVSGKQDELVLVQQTDNDYLVWFAADKKVTLTEAQFLGMWTGVAVISEPEAGNEPEKTAAINQWVLPVVVCALWAWVCVAFNASMAIAAMGYLALTGLAFSWLVIHKEYGKTAPIARKLCNMGKAVDCDVVLQHAENTKLLGVPFSAAAWVYFFAQAITAFGLTIAGANATLLLWGAVLPLPVLLYALYYQGVVVKQWCTLCLAITVVAFGQMAVAVPSVLPATLPTIPGALGPVLGLALILALVNYRLLKQHLTQQAELRKTTIDYRRFTGNYELYQNLQAQEPEVTAFAGAAHELVFGAAANAARAEVLFITHPQCGFCKEIPPLINRLLATQAQGLSIRVRFNIHDDTGTGFATQQAAALLHTYHTQGQQAALKLYANIHGSSSTSITATDKVVQQMNALLQAQRQWCIDNGINFTPLMLVNGRRFPEIYDMGHVLLFVDDLLEEQEEEAQLGEEAIAD